MTACVSLIVSRGGLFLHIVLVGWPVAQLVHHNRHPLHLMLVFSEVASRMSLFRPPVPVDGAGEKMFILQRPRVRFAASPAPATVMVSTLCIRAM